MALLDISSTSAFGVLGLARTDTTKRSHAANGKYHKQARDRPTHLEQGTAPGDTGPFQKVLYELGQKGRVITPVAGGFAGVPHEKSLGTCAISGLISSVLAKNMQLLPKNLRKL